VRELDLGLARELDAEAVEGLKDDPRVALALSQVVAKGAVEADEDHLPALVAKPLRDLDPEHRLARPGAAADEHPRVAGQALEQRGLLVRERDQRLLVVEQLVGHRDRDPDVAREQLAQHPDPRLAGRRSLLARAAVVGDDARDRRRGVAKVVAVEDQLPRRVRREGELVHGDVREGEAVAEVQVPMLAARDLGDLALQAEAVVDRLREGVADPLPLAVDEPEPLAVLALDPPALDLEAEDRLLRVGEDEVDLALGRALGVVARHPADGVEDVPGVLEAVAQRLEHARLAPALDVGREQRARVHRRHGRVSYRHRAARASGSRRPARPA